MYGKLHWFDWNRGLAIVSSPFVFFTGLVMLLAFASWQAQATETAQLRVFVFARDVSAMDVFLDDEYISALSTQPPAPWAATEYYPVSEGSRSLTFTSEGGDPASPLFDNPEITLEAGHTYTAAVIGLAAEDALQMVLIDETAAFEGIDLEGQAAFIYVHAVYGAPNLDFYMDGELIAEDVGFGEYVTRAVPGDGQPEAYRLSETGNSDAVFLEVGPPWRNADVYRFTGISGRYPGTPGPRGDYSFVLGMFAYTGEITIVDGGSIAVGESVEVNLGEVGSRVRYALTLDDAAILNVLLSSADTEADAYLRVFDADGLILYANDELIARDEDWDAGLEQLELEAGSYFIEAASFGDLFPGVYQLEIASAG